MADVVVDTENKSAKELIGQGIRAYILQDYSSAVSALSKASELLVTEHGDDLHDSLADVYLYYGKALLGVSREECEALGDAIPKNKEEDSDEEDETENTETEEGDEKDEGETKANGDVKKVDNSDGGGESSTSEGVNKVEQAEATTSEEVDEKADNDDEPTDLQVAWEVLELAKKIYQKRGEEGQKNLAETLTVLGEISLESENFEAAINDIKEGLKIQKELFGDDSRTVAETYYKLGVAYSTNSQIDEAIQSFNDSLQYLQNRVSHLEKVKDQKDEDEIQDEIKEIKNLIPDVEEKITDMKSYKDEVCQCDIRTTIRDLVSKPNFGEIDKSTINKLQVKRKPTLEDAMEKINL